MDSTICEAIRARKLLMFGYAERVRVVEPHLYGVNTAGNEALSAWLRAGYSRSDPGGGWRTYLVPEMYRVQVLDEVFDGPRPGYNPRDERMVRVFCGLEAGATGQAADGQREVDEPTTYVRAGEGHAIQFEGLGTILKVPGGATGGSVAVVEHTLKAGWLGAPPHRHSHEDEVSYVLEGELTVQQRGAVTTAGPGEFIIKPRGIFHAFWNTGSRTARFLEIISPAGFERYFAELAPLIPDNAPPDIEGIFALAERYGLEFDMSAVPGLLEQYGLRME